MILCIESIILGKCSNNVIVNIFNSKCCHFYGAQAWNFCDKNIVHFQKMWNRCIRHMLDLPLVIHCNILPCLVERLNAHEQIFCRFSKMIQNMLHSENSKLETCLDYLCQMLAVLYI